VRCYTRNFLFIWILFGYPLWFLPHFLFEQMQIMRETLIYLSHLDHDDTEKQVQCHHDDTGLCVLICEILRISSLMIKYAFYQMSFSLL
jgi:hypothetical protein